MSAVFFQPWGIAPGQSYFSWNASTVEEIIARNPETLGEGGLWSKPFLLPRSSERPFPIFVGTVDGPRSVDGDESWLGALAPCNRSFTQLHQTPLYVGQPVPMAVEYHQGCEKGRGEDDRPECTGKAVVVSTGGFIEPFAFGSEVADSATLLPLGSKASGLMRMTVPPVAFGITDAASISSMGPSGVFEEASCPAPLRPYWPHLKELEISKAMFPTASALEDDAAPLLGSVDMVLGDGGNLDNVGLFGLLQRKVGTIVLFLNTEAQLDPNWDFAADPPAPDGNVRIDNFLAAAFGFQQHGCDTSDFDNSLQFTVKNQVFSSEAFGPIVGALQDAIRAGSGAVATMSIETVANEWLGIPLGQPVISSK